MRAHHLGGDRAAALRAFDRCRTALSRELGTDPLPETLALHRQILQAEHVLRTCKRITPHFSNQGHVGAVPIARGRIV